MSTERGGEPPAGQDAEVARRWPRLAPPIDGARVDLEGGPGGPRVTSGGGWRTVPARHNRRR